MTRERGGPFRHPPCVRIVCVDPTHETKAVRIDFVIRNEQGVWYANPGEASGRPLRSMTMVNTVDDSPTDEEVAHGNGRSYHRPRSRRRFNFKCPLCGTEAVVRGEVLDEFLDRWVDYFKDTLPGDLPLGVLAASLSGK